jgi:preprotein translocase subunit YajC
MSPVHVISFPTIHTVAVLAGPFLAAAAKKSSGSITLIFFVLLFGVGYMFLIRPQRQRRQRQMQTTKQIAVGDKVMLSSGIIGRVEGFVGDHARVEVAPGTVIEVLRQAVTQRIDEPGDGDQVTDAPPSYDAHGHHDDIDDSGPDPYSVPPLESGDSSFTGDDVEGHQPGGSANGGGSR